MLKLDLLIIAVHPDDAELGAGGTMAKYVAEGKKVGIVDLTRGELGTRGTPETRDSEAKAAAAILGLAVRENLELRDGFFENAEKEKMAIIQSIRKYKPEIIITNAITDRHPDHGRAAQMVSEACFLAGLRKIETSVDGVNQEVHRPRLVLQVVQDYYIKPDIVLDITDYYTIKEQSILAYKTQFYTGEVVNPDEPQTYISNPDFMESTAARAREFGRSIQVKYAEGFTSKKILGVDDIFHLI
ncbi:bacillithiol biosynthesis deacetylase BshB1 [Sphingobacterium sp. SRCM116780]|uniref:bacillithiol biosynthesis deacetylase BshB1 n=1 Tax=Sphingobacterium sp. SRCM116780 TaxID=2907623 RepID=UPI001F17EF72|nr:bacillithiol biosynthesis deacetylase BshB1 [Sphingobacterium sp. SRCM116780]UIR57562.1 bacillithiol biosynthesis deacetylase BshB1 [Sphingobacterium sp. SRCM116780]